MLIKNQKINKRKSGSEVTISNSSTSNRIANIQTADDQIPKSNSLLRANPGGAILRTYDLSKFESPQAQSQKNEEHLTRK
jgi:hypothetical protein